MSDNKPVYVVQHNHFDPIWRRCWDRTFDYEGKRYRSYAELEKIVFDGWIENAKDGATFSEGQAVVVRKYIENRPEMLPVLQDLVKKGIFELTAAGETVADTNMPSGETLLRNLVMGQWWFEDVFGVTPSVGWLEDAFGQSAQVPQIFRGCEVKQVARLCYKRVPGSYWKGLDGSVICLDEYPHMRDLGNFTKIAPCPECNGYGCDSCDNTGFGPTGRISDEAAQKLLDANFEGDPFSMLVVGGEEMIPDPNIGKLIADAQAQGKPFVWGSWADSAREYADVISKVDDPDIEVSDQMEANPVSTGCYVSRIAIKQAFRRVEHKLISAEKWATAGWLRGETYPHDELQSAWRNLIFTAFHDAITSTHIDAAFHELMDMFKEAESRAESITSGVADSIEASLPGDGKRLVIYNSESWERDDLVTAEIPGVDGVPTLTDKATGESVNVLSAEKASGSVRITFNSPSVPALGYRVLEVGSNGALQSSVDEQEGSGEIENEFYRITAGDKGITSIFDKRTGREVLSADRYLANELILEEDEGHPWGTQKAPEFELKLSNHTVHVTVSRSGGVGEITLIGEYRGDDANTRELRWKQVTRLYDGSPIIDFTTDIGWDSRQRRIRVAFPTAINTNEAFYAIPYGAIKRGPYEHELNILPSTNGDWPAINWIDLYEDKEDWGIGLLNAGTPSHKVEDGVIFLSILRSPTDSWCLNEPEFYDCPDFDGARDTGHHTFRYALVPHAGDWRQAGLEKLGREFNTPLLARVVDKPGSGTLPPVHAFMTFEGTSNVIVTAVKKAEKDDSVIVRLAETNGSEGSAAVALEGAGKMTAVTNYLERRDEPVTGESVKLDPFKVVTVRLGNQ